MPSKPTLYSFWRSSCAWRVRIALALKGIEYEYKAVDIFNGAQNNPEYRKISPFGMVPCLLHDGTAIVESMAIIEYLEEKFPYTKRLLPDKPEDRATVRALAYMITSNIQPIQTNRVANYYGQGDQEKANSWNKHFIEVGFHALEQMLQKTAGKYAFGDSLSLADMCIPAQVFNARFSRVKRYGNYFGGGGCCQCGECGGPYGGSQGMWQGPSSYEKRILMEERYSNGGAGQWQSFGNGGGIGGPPMGGGFGPGGGVVGLVNGILFGR
uniref:maleylacetoacetate isomerase n=1 Tax=Acrobeloides nanus TaxID=290746 RepID=A0A914DVA4_9BILA